MLVEVLPSGFVGFLLCEMPKCMRSHIQVALDEAINGGIAERSLGVGNSSLAILPILDPEGSVRFVREVDVREVLGDPPSHFLRQGLPDLDCLPSSFFNDDSDCWCDDDFANGTNELMTRVKVADESVMDD
jgi:hypothetical protein